MVLLILWRLSASVIAAVLTPDPARKTKPTDRRKLWQVHNICIVYVMNITCIFRVYTSNLNIPI